VLPVDDRAVVAALVSGDPRGLDGAYRAYADRLYTYCRGMLRDADAAADAVHDTFILAGQRAGQLRDPDRLRSWLYAIARNECLRILRRRGRHVPLEEAGQVSAPSTDPDAPLHAAEVQELVRAAAAGLNPGDREVFELAVRHDLAAPEIGAALGVSGAHAHARLSRARGQLERALGALLVARTGRGDCPELDALLTGWDGVLTALVRKRISRHIDACDTCAERRRRQLTPAALFSAYASAPMLVAPVEIRQWLQLTSTDAAYAEAVDRRSGRWDPDSGFPVPLELQRRRTAVAGVAAVAVAAVFAFGGGYLLGGAPGPPDDAHGAPPPTAPQVEAPQATPPATAPATPQPTSPPPTTAAPSPTPVPGLTVEATVIQEDCGTLVRSYRLEVEAVASQDLEAALLVIDYELSGPTRYPMETDGPTASLAHDDPRLLDRPVFWHVEVIATDGARAQTEQVEACLAR
jgi:RNA polymerase sigma factor (sigma-70 family)